MQTQLADCKSLNYPIAREVETCFIIVEKFTKVLRILVGEEFDSEAEEIEFFKTWLPKFEAENQYYGLLYHSVLFEPELCSQAKQFWQRESTRLERFQKEHQGFVHYYTAGFTHLDRFYFLHNNDINGENACSSDMKASELVSLFLALQRFHSHACIQLNNIDGLNQNNS
jgi:hypothetical protein